MPNSDAAASTAKALPLPSPKRLAEEAAEPSPAPGKSSIKAAAKGEPEAFDEEAATAKESAAAAAASGGGGGGSKGDRAEAAIKVGAAARRMQAALVYCAPTRHESFALLHRLPSADSSASPAT